MIRFMIDTDDLSKLTNHVELLATYSDLVPNLATLQKQYPHSEIVLIDRGRGDPSGQASVFDIEPGCLTIGQAVQAYDRQKARGIRYLTAYHDRNIMLEVNAAFGHRHPFNWIATLDGTAHIQGYVPLTTPAVIQVLSAQGLDYHADGSLVFEDGWHPTAPRINMVEAHNELNDALTRIINAQGNLHRLAAAIGV